MLKRILISLPLLVAAAMPATSFAVPPDHVVAMPAGTPVAFSPTPGNAVSQACDQYGVCQVALVASAIATPQAIVPGTGATNLGKARDTSGTGASDVGVQGLYVRRDTAGTLITTNNNYSPGIVNAFGSQKVDIDRTFQVSGDVNGILKAEDSAAATGDALVGVAGVVNTNLGGALTNSNGDYGGIAIALNGAVYVQPSVNNNLISGIVAEDFALADQQAVNVIGLQREDALTLNTGSSGDATFAKGDALGRTITTLAPAGESFYACTGLITTATNTTLKAAVASNRIYVTALSCANNSVTGQLVTFADGAGGATIAAGYATSTAISEGFQRTYPVPLRLTSNTLLNVATNAAGSVLCCASGYVSVN